MAEHAEQLLQPLDVTEQPNPPRELLPNVPWDGASYTAQVRMAVVENLADPALCSRSVARQLRQSERTLRRQLREAGTSYQAILDGVREEWARLYLQAGLTAAEVSRRVGYRDPRAIYRAFRRWTGQSLASYRVPAAVNQP